MNGRNYVIALTLLCVAGCAEQERSALQWSPRQASGPKAAVEVQWFKDNDFLSAGTDGVGRLQPLSAVMDTFCGTNPLIRQAFSDWVSEYEFPKFYYHPAHPVPDGYNLVFTAYHAPYECYQSQFLNWMKMQRGQDDFLLPAARKLNPYRGDLADPVVSGRNLVDEELLRKTFGYVAVAEPDKITFIGDNRYNPLRWICPINEIHHREQPSWGMRLHVRPELWSRTVKILQNYRTSGEGSVGEKILLRYEIALQIEDCRKGMGEFSLKDYLESGKEGEVGLVKQLYNNSLDYAAGKSRDGVALVPLQQKMVEKYVQTRLEPVNFQLSVGINFKERDDRYRHAEFMLCSYNQEPCGVFPEEASGEGCLATACDALNPLVVDGGNNGRGSWWRVPVSTLNHRALRKGGVSLWQGTDYLELKKPELDKTVFKGEIDVTRFYRQSLAAGFFPGQRGYWVNRWVGFEGDVPELRNPDEKHGVEWAFFIFENHGPLKVVAEIHELDVVIIE